LGLHCDGSIPAREPGKRPEDVYELTYRVRSRIGATAAAMNLDPYIGFRLGFRLPRKNDAPIAPADVLNLMNILLAGIGKLGTALAITRPIIVNKPQSPRDPADVLEAIRYADQLASCLDHRSRALG
jgi:hypothetical protein